MVEFGDSVWLVVVSALWGCTNPLLKCGGRGIEELQEKNVLLRILLQLKFLLLNWKYMIPFLLNQSGSLVFYLTLATVDLSLAVPVTNSLAFLFTSLTAKLMGEKIGNSGTYVGMFLVAIGVSICVYSKS